MCSKSATVGPVSDNANRGATDQPLIRHPHPLVKSEDTDYASSKSKFRFARDKIGFEVRFGSLPPGQHFGNLALQLEMYFQDAKLEVRRSSRYIEPSMLLALSLNDSTLAGKSRGRVSHDWGQAFIESWNVTLPPLKTTQLQSNGARWLFYSGRAMSANEQRLWREALPKDRHVMNEAGLGFHWRDRDTAILPVLTVTDAITRRKSIPLRAKSLDIAREQFKGLLLYVSKESVLCLPLEEVFRNAAGTDQREQIFVAKKSGDKFKIKISRKNLRPSECWLKIYVLAGHDIEEQLMRKFWAAWLKEINTLPWSTVYQALMTSGCHDSTPKKRNAAIPRKKKTKGKVAEQSTDDARFRELWTPSESDAEDSDTEALDVQPLDITGASHNPTETDKGKGDRQPQTLQPRSEAAQRSKPVSVPGLPSNLVDIDAQGASVNVPATEEEDHSSITSPIQPSQQLFRIVKAPTPRDVETTRSTYTPRSHNTSVRKRNRNRKRGLVSDNEDVSEGLHKRQKFDLSDRPWPCPMPEGRRCNQRFLVADHARGHAVAVHEHQTPFTCGTCFESFTRSGLEDHLSETRHTRLRTYYVDRLNVVSTYRERAEVGMPAEVDSAVRPGTIMLESHKVDADSPADSNQDLDSDDEWLEALEESKRDRGTLDLQQGAHRVRPQRLAVQRENGLANGTWTQEQIDFLKDAVANYEGRHTEMLRKIYDHHAATSDGALCGLSGKDIHDMGFTLGLKDSNWTTTPIHKWTREQDGKLKAGYMKHLDKRNLWCHIKDENEDLGKLSTGQLKARLQKLGLWRA